MSKDDKDEKAEKSDKTLFFSRCIAYIVDIFLVLFVSSLLATPFVNADQMMSLTNESHKLVEKYNNKKITEQEYIVEASNLEYKMARSTELVSLFSILLSVIYFVVLPLYWDGKTVGKKIMKMKIVSKDGELTANQLIFRSFIADFVLLNIISALFIMFASRSVYLTCVEIFTFTQYLIMVVSIFTIIINKEGLAIHDMLVHTKVVNDK